MWIVLHNSALWAFSVFDSQFSMDRTPYQEKIIKRYYENRSDLMQQKLSELVTDLYLAEGKKRTQVWKRITIALENLKIPAAQIEALVAADNPAQLAKFLEKSNK